MPGQHARIRSLSLHFPALQRTNSYFRERFPDLVAQAEGKSFARAFSPAEAPPRPAAAGGTPCADDPWTEEMRPFLHDPFRGTLTRRILGEEESSLTMEEAAAQAALRAAGLGAGDVDLLMVSSLFPEHPGPGNAPYLAARLGHRGGAFSLESMCVGPWVALHNATALLRGGAARRVLIVTSCSYSRYADERDTLSFFMGDGASAMVLEAPGDRAPAGDGGGVLGARMMSTADTLDVFYCERVVDERGRPRELVRAAADAGRRIPSTVVSYIRPVCMPLLDSAGVRLEDVDFFIFNTPTAWYERVFARALGVPFERTINVYPRYGNVGTVLPAANLYHAVEEGRIREGSLVLVFAMGYSSNAVAALIRWGDTALAAPPPPAAIA